jgi:hypothetical protein
MCSVHYSSESGCFEIKKDMKKEDIMHAATSGHWENH